MSSLAFEWLIFQVTENRCEPFSFGGAANDES